nr:AlpA family phage regulatory protein [Sphingobium fuliginis]
MRTPHTIGRASLSISSIYRRETSDRFPHRLHLRIRAVA